MFLFMQKRKLSKFCLLYNLDLWKKNSALTVSKESPLFQNGHSKKWWCNMASFAVQGPKIFPVFLQYTFHHTTFIYTIVYAIIQNINLSLYLKLQIYANWKQICHFFHCWLADFNPSGFLGELGPVSHWPLLAYIIQNCYMTTPPRPPPFQPLYWQSPALTRRWRFHQACSVACC